MDSEDDVMQFMRNFDVDCCELYDDILDDGERLIFHGHDVTGHVTEDGNDKRKPYPKTVIGSFKGRGPVQCFGETEGYVVDGMCGGPVILADQRFKRDNLACGMLEGIVSLSHPVPPLRGLAAFVSAQELSLFLAQVEAGAPEVLRLDGGEALRSIAEAEDPANLTLEGLEQRCKNMEKEKEKERDEKEREKGKVKGRSGAGDWYQ
jgi:hypothetical protein